MRSGAESHPRDESGSRLWGNGSGRLWPPGKAPSDWETGPVRVCRRSHPPSPFWQEGASQLLFLTAIAAVVLARARRCFCVEIPQDAKDDAKRPFTSVQVLVADKTFDQYSFPSAIDNKHPWSEGTRAARPSPATSR